MDNRTNISREIDSAGDKLQLDEAIKKVLGDKQILALILNRVAPEFKGYSKEETMSFIEGSPEISKIPITPGDKIMGSQTENISEGENIVRFDVRFVAYVPNSDKTEKIKLIVNVEGQNNFHPGYDLVTRGIF